MKKSFCLETVGALALFLVGSASAGTVIQLGGGWQATIEDDPFIDIAVDFVSLEDDILVIEKFANFTSLSALDVVFTQVGTDAETVSQIAISDELVYNGTGSAWTSYQNILIGDAVWNTAATAGVAISPFTTMNFSDGDTVLTLSNGVVNDGDFFTPGLFGGAFIIDVDLSGDVASFTLSEVPIPAPGAAVLLALGLLGGGRRRR